MAPPKTFNFNLAPGEYVTRWPTPYPTPYPTPAPSQPLAYVVKGEEVPPTTEFMKAWFLQSIIPLVGAKAVNTLSTMIKDEDWDKFLKKALEFRKHLA
jgi:hypothetical protein